MKINKSELPKNSEQWASIDGYCNYEVSWWGRVRNSKTGRILKPGIGSHGYVLVCLSKEGKSKTPSIHKLVADAWVENAENKRCIDHIDCDKHNNHHENLRAASHSENNMNTKAPANKSSMYKGVYLHKQSNKYAAYFSINGIRKHLGCFTNEREAAESYNTAAREHFGDFARLNEFSD